MGREVAQGVVAPVVLQLLGLQRATGDGLVDRQQLDGGDPQAGQVLDDCRVGETGVRAPDPSGTSGWAAAKPLTWTS